nr:uncharacterized protein LOC109146924 [Ipomoea batatas]
MSHGRGSAANVFRYCLAEEGPPPPSTVKSLRAATPSCCSPCDGRCRYPNQLRRSAEEEDRRPWPMFVVAAVGIAAEELLATHGCSWLAGVVRCQDEGEALKTYLTRWQKEVQTIEGLDEQVAITFFMESLRADHLLRICQNERVILPSIEPKTIPEDVCVTKELDPEEHPEVFWMEEIRIPHSQSHNQGSEEILLSLREVVGVSLPSPHQKEWGEGPREYPPPHGHRVPVSVGGAFLGGPARLNEESAVKEDQHRLSSSLQEV